MTDVDRNVAHTIALLIAAALAPACARAIVCTTPDAGRGHVAAAVVDAQGIRGRYRLHARDVSNPSEESALCSPAVYQVREDASFIELAPGTYDLAAEVSPAGDRLFFGFAATGRVTVQASRCYSLSVTCAREEGLDWEETCHPILVPRPCSSRPSGRRVPMRSEQAC